MIYDSILETIGNTPMVKLNKLKKELNLKGNIYAKIESFNPGGSVKDRAALKMIKALEQSNIIDRNTTLIEVTSGNTGVGLAMVCAYLGYNLLVVMPENMSEERKKLMKAYGARLILTDPSLGMKGAISKGYELEKEYKNAKIIGQFINPNNPMAHYETTGPEIYRDLKDDIDYLVCGVGTGGTITGVARYLKENIKTLHVCAVEPAESPMLSYGETGKHKIQGIGAGFIPEILDVKIYDEIIRVKADDAYNMSRLLAKTCGILVGISSGAALFAACEIAKRDESLNKNIVVVLPDTGERYLSTDLF